jgi:hypothetical protein
MAGENKDEPPSQPELPMQPRAPKSEGGEMPTEPEVHWIWAAITKKWPAVKGFVVHLALFALGVLSMIFLYDKFIISG